jgi:hypothetical protein
MYGNGATSATERAWPDIPDPVEQVSSINDSAIQNLRDSSYALDQLLAKVRGSQPNKAEGGEKVIERYLLTDAYSIRALAVGISERVAELHRVIGHEK